jgi:hypothetical protein
MACTRHQRLIQIWKLLVYERPGDSVTVDAYWQAIEHKILCEVCRDEALVHGCFSTYLMISASLRKPETKHDSIQ